MMEEEQRTDMHENGLEPHQYLNIYQEYDEPFKVGKGNVIQYLLYFGVGLVVVSLVLAAVIKIPREVNVAFELRGGSNEIIAQYPDRIYIQKRYVSIGERIKPGDRVMTIYSEQIINHIEEITMLRSEMDFLKEKSSLLYDAEKQLLLQRKQGFEKEMKLLTQKIDEHEEQYNTSRDNLKEQIKLQRKAHERNITLHQDKVISDGDLDQSMQAVRALEQQLFSASDILETRLTDFQRELKSLENEVLSIDKQLGADLIKQANQLSNLERRLALAHEMLEVRYGRCSINGRYLDLLGPSAGIIRLLNESSLEIPPSEILWRLEVSKNEYQGYAEANSRQIGSLKAGQKVVLKLESFPHYYYGTLKAQISELSSSPNASGDFPLVLSIDDFGELEQSLAKGMRGTATVIVEEKTILQHLFKKVLQYTTLD